MNDGTVFPKSSPTELKAKFCIWPEQTLQPTTSGGTNQTVITKTPNRCPRDSIPTIYDHHPKNFSNWERKTASPWFSAMDTKKFIQEQQITDCVKYSPEDLTLWLESEYPVHLPWTKGVIALLPEIEIPSFFRPEPNGRSYQDQVADLYVAINEHGELGFVKHGFDDLTHLSFDHELADGIKNTALEAGWLMTDFNDEQETHDKYHNKPTKFLGRRIDDGFFDQRTHAFYPGRRCGWCGSSSIKPFFIGEPQCVACHSKDDAIEARDNMNIQDKWL